MVFLIDPGDLKGPKCPKKSTCSIDCTTFCGGVIQPMYGIPDPPQ